MKPSTYVAPMEADTDSMARCNHVVELLLRNRGTPAAEIDRVLIDAPRLVFGHCLRAALIVRADDDSARPKLAASVAAIESACSDVGDPAHRHASAARAWLDGDEALAAERYGAILIDRPRDILALMAAHALDFRLGERRMLRDRVARILPAWDPAAPHYPSVLAMYAFGLEENGQYRRAEKMARYALTLDPGHPGAIHVISHVMEMQGRAKEGLEFLRETEPMWTAATGISVHLAWHRALFHLDADDPKSALAVYDAQITNAHADISELADASALLWRLQLRGVRAGARWRELADSWERQNLSGARAFYFVHAIMAFAAAGRPLLAVRACAGMPQSDRGSETLMPPLCKGLIAFARGEYSACVEWLMRVKSLAHRCGGSLAQCDLIHLTFTEAAFRARKTNLARALVAERTAQKPASRLNRLLQRRLG